LESRLAPTQFIPFLGNHLTLESSFFVYVRFQSPHGLVWVDMKVPTFDGHLNSGNTSSREVFDGIQAAQEIDRGVQA